MKWVHTAQQALKAFGFEYITLQSIFLIIFLPISLVYAGGRGLNLLKTQMAKNITAIVTVVTFSVLSVLNLIPPKVSNILFLISVGFFRYVVLWQKFYTRADKKLDNVIGEDEGENGNGFAKKKGKNQ